MDIQPTKPEPDSHTLDMGPGKSFRNFRFDTALILQAMEASFSSWKSSNLYVKFHVTELISPLSLVVFTIHAN